MYGIVRDSGNKKHKSRGREFNTNIFFSNFSGAPGISRQNPGISRQKSSTSLVSRGVPNFSAPKRETANGRNRFLQKSAVSCENLRFPAVFCANLRLPNPLIYRARRESAKICKNLRNCAFRVWFLPFAVSLLARPDENQDGDRNCW